MAMERPEGQPRPEVTNVSPIPESDQGKRGWVLEVNGEVIPNVRSASLTQTTMHVKLEYGKTPAGYDGLALEEPGGGGSVTIPFVEIDGEVYIGMAIENRPYSGGRVPNVPRGFLDPGESHFEVATREPGEEMQYEPIKKDVELLEGESMNPNSTFFVTIGPDKGVRFFKLEVDPNEVRVAEDSENPVNKVFEFNPGVLKAKEGDRLGERIYGSKFYHWTKAVKVKDMFTSAGVGRLIADEIYPRLIKKLSQ